MPTTSLDFKFWLSLLAAIAGVVIPVWLWQFDLNSRSLSLRLASSLGLQSEAKTSIPDLELRIDGRKLENPHLSILSLTNDGSRPISASDFETPIQIIVGEKTEIVRARISSTMPEDLHGEVTSSNARIELNPLLLNPKDVVELAIVTSGDSPTFSVRSRINGISRIAYQDDTRKKVSWATAVVLFALSLSAMILYAVFGVALVRPNAFSLSRPVAGLTMIFCMFSGLVMYGRAYEAIAMKPDRSVSIGLATIIGIAISSISLYLLRRSRRYR